MIIDTKFLGEIEIKEEDVLYFEEGMLGFADVKKYVILGLDETGTFSCLQSTERKEVGFIVINPWKVFKDYDIDIDDSELAAFSDKDINNIAVYSIVTVTEKNMTANLLGPVVINAKTRQGKQVVLHSSGYTTKHIIKSFAKRG